MSDPTDGDQRLEQPVGHRPGTGRPGAWQHETDVLYEAERRLVRWVEEGSVRLGGVSWLPERDPLFRDVGEAARFSEQACDRLGVPRVTVRARRGPKQAHYTPALMEIAVPTAERGGVWALRGLVVIHELAHHLVAVGGVQEGGPHGATFRTRLMHALDVLGYPVQAQLLRLALETDAATPEQETWRTRIGAILRQAEATPHRAEAETFMARAQELATRHAIDLALLSARDQADGRPQAEKPEEVTVVMGRSGQRWLRNHCKLFMAVARPNDVSYLLASNSTRMYAHGMPSDIAMTVALYESLRAQMVTSAAAWMRTGAWKQEYTLRGTARGYEEQPVHWSTAKTSFYEGFVSSVAERLAESQRRAEEAATRPPSSGAPSADAAATRTVRPGPGPTPGAALHSTALALAAKREKVRAFHDEITARLKAGRWRGNDYTPVAHSASGARAGREAGRRAAMGSRRRQLSS